MECSPLRAACPLHLYSSRPTVGCLRRDPRNNHPRQLRIEPHDTIAADGEIRRIKHRRFDKIQDSSINLRSLRLREVEDELRRPIPALVHNANSWVIPVGNRLDAKPAFENRVGIVQDRVDGVRCIAIARQMEWRRTLFDGMPIVWNWPTACSAPFNRRALPRTEIGGCAIGLQCAQFDNGIRSVCIEARQCRVGNRNCPLPFFRATN
jgi:hypothetical protein